MEAPCPECGDLMLWVGHDFYCYICMAPREEIERVLENKRAQRCYPCQSGRCEECDHARD